ncbi:MAG: MBL fold metallo-hydrolase [Thermodesulfobacteriota bacterium]
MKITFWGTRGSIAVPGRDTNLYGGNTTCLEVVLENGKTLILDAGTGIRRLGGAMQGRNGGSPLYLLMTHAHWDHIIGFPFFATGLKKGTELLVDGHSNAMMGLRHTFDNPMGGGYFPISIQDLDIKISYLNILAERPLELEDACVESIPLRHPQGGMGFRIREGARTMVFLTDNELDGEEAFREYEKFCRGADLLIHDAQYSPDEVSARRGWGHSDYESALELARRAEVHKLVLFHHDPSRTDVELKAFELLCRDISRKRECGLVVEAAREDTVIKL